MAKQAAKLSPKFERLLSRKIFKASVVRAAQKPQSFAYAIPDAGEPVAYLIFHRMKKPKETFAVLKSHDKAIKKKAHGVVEFDRSTKELRFKNDLTPPGGMLKAIKKLLKQHKVAVRPVLCKADGSVLEADPDPIDLEGEDLSAVDESELEVDPEEAAEDDVESAADTGSGAGAEAPEPPAMPTDDDHRAVALKKALKTAAEAIPTVLKAAPSVRTGELKTELMGIVATAKSQIDAAALDEAKASIATLAARLKELRTGFESESAGSGAASDAAPAAPETATADAPTDPEDAAARKALRAELKAHGALVKKAIVANPGEHADLMAMMAAAKESIKDAPLDEARDSVQAIAAHAQAVIDGKAPSASSSGTESSDATAPATIPGIVAMQKARLEWDSARKHAQSELQRLEKAILDQCRELEEFPEISARTEYLYTLLDGRDQRLLDALDAVLEKPGDVRASSTVRSLIGDYRSFLDSSPLAASVDANPFLPVSAVATLSDKLTKLEAVLI